MSTTENGLHVYKVKINFLDQLIIEGPAVSTSSTVTDSATSPVLTLGKDFTDSALGGDTIKYLGAADKLGKGAVGFIGYDTVTKQLYLFSPKAVSGTTFLNPSFGPNDPFKGNWNVATGHAQSGHKPHCFMAGTAIGTPAGDVAVETLGIGDLVSLHDGATAPVAWIGRHTVSTIFSDKLRVLPIRIKAGALGDELPVRDLLVSPEHAILIDGALMQAGALVNDVSILQETAVPQIFTYYHVEVAKHSLVLAEGAAAETFVDNVDRMAFDNWAEHEALYGGAAAVTELDYPRAKAWRQVPAATRDRLLALGQALFGTEIALAS